MTMTFTVIHDGSTYTVRSYGNGWAYEIDNHECADTLFFQDHEADEIKKITNNFENMSALDAYFE